MCIAVVKMDRLSPNHLGDGLGAKHDSCDEGIAPDFLEVQMGRQIIMTQRDKGCERARHGSQFYSGLRNASPTTLHHGRKHRFQSQAPGFQIQACHSRAGRVN